MVPYDRSTFVKAVAIQLPQTRRWSQQLLTDRVLVISRSAVQPSVMLLNGFISAVLVVLAWWIFADAAVWRHELTTIGVVIEIALLFAAVIPFFVTQVMRQDRRVVAELIETDGSTEIFVEPCDDPQLRQFLSSVVEALCRLHTSTVSPIAR